MKQWYKTFERNITQSKGSFNCKPVSLFTFDLGLPSTDSTE